MSESWVSLAVGRTMPEGDDPILGGVGQIGLEPGETYCSRILPEHVFGIEYDEVDVGKIE